MAKIDKVQEVAIEKLKPYERNAKIHTEEQIRKIVESIKEFGFISPCIIDSEYNLIAGHGRVEACKALGMDKVPCLFVEGLTDEQRRAYILADNKLTEMGKWDKSLVSIELAELKDIGYDINVTGFDIDSIIFDDMEGDTDDTPEDNSTVNDKEPPRVKRGEIWQLGNHRLMCGDSTKTEDVMKLMEDEQADLLLTDPPYNVAVSNSQGMTIENDNLDEAHFAKFLDDAFYNANLVLKDGGAFYVWYASLNVQFFMDALVNNGLTPHQELVWVKSSFILGRSDYQWRHEPCLYGWKEGAAHYFIDMRTLATIQNDNLDDLSKDEAIEKLKEILSITTTIYEKKVAVNTIHPTMKPVGMIKKLVRNSCKENELVLDLFGGSGSTLIACEEMNRRCNMMEYDEKYASAIVKRWEELTGKEACKLEEK